MSEEEEEGGRVGGVEPKGDVAIAHRLLCGRVVLHTLLQLCNGGGGGGGMG